MARTKRRSLAPLLAFVLPVLAGHHTPASAGPPKATAESMPASTAGLADRIDAALAAKFLEDAKVSVRIVDLSDGKIIYEKNPELALNPASNVKLFTTAAALWVLGPEHRYPTGAYADTSKLADGVLSDPIYLRGGGDPALVTGDMYELAVRVRAAGIKRITGGIVVDPSRFDSDGLPPGFDQKDEFASYRAPTGATSVNFNTYQVLVAAPGGMGSAPQATVSPDVPSIRIANEAKAAEGTRNRLTVAVDEKDGITTVTLRGTMGVDAPRAAYRYPVSDPSQYAGEVFGLVLRQAGIKLSKRTVKVGAVPSKGSLLARHRSPTLGVLIRSVNKLSNNFMAEQILRTLVDEDGATARAALDRLAGWSGELGVPQSGLRLGNGSGLYDNNRISAAQMTHMLARVHGDFRYRADFLASLAVMGVDGTTRKRLKDSGAERWIRAKTGTLDGVSALSGYAGAPGKQPVAFSIFMNDLGRWETGAARRVQNQIAEMVALELAKRPG